MKIISIQRRCPVTGIMQNGRPICEPINAKLSRTLTDTEYVWEVGGYQFKLFIPAGYIFDGASIPWFAWSLLRLAPHGIMDTPALPHDDIYHHKGKIPQGFYWIWNKYDSEWVECSEPIPREIADLLLEQLCVFSGACEKRRALEMWAAVRVFGWWAWHRDDDRRKDLAFDALFKKEMSTP